MWLKFINNHPAQKQLVNLDYVSRISIEREGFDRVGSESNWRLSVYMSSDKLDKDEAGGYISLYIEINKWDVVEAIQNYICDCLESNVVICDLDKFKEEHYERRNIEEDK